VGAIEHLETALYFSMVTFTTLGCGDVTLPSDWREMACRGSNDLDRAPERERLASSVF
jgi:hypothetical protein